MSLAEGFNQFSNLHCECLNYVLYTDRHNSMICVLAVQIDCINLLLWLKLHISRQMYTWPITSSYHYTVYTHITLHKCAGLKEDGPLLSFHRKLKDDEVQNINHTFTTCIIKHIAVKGVSTLLLNNFMVNAEKLSQCLSLSSTRLWQFFSPVCRWEQKDEAGKRD